jgi:hypothetical protein
MKRLSEGVGKETGLQDATASLPQERTQGHVIRDSVH